MISLNGDWTGKIVGTNNADIFVEMTEEAERLIGTIRINDPMYGASVYECTGRRDGSTIQFEADPTSDSRAQGVTLGHVNTNGNLVEENRIEGKWVSSVGTGGTFWIVRGVPQVDTTSKSTGTEMDNSVFIMMSISQDDPSAEDCLNAIKRATSQHGIEAIRVDEIEHSNRITDLILKKINSSRFLVCDITNERPNVYYELGYAHGIEKEVILVAKVGTPIHFDIKDYNVIFYKSYSELEERVARRIGEGRCT